MNDFWYLKTHLPSGHRWIVKKECKDLLEFQAHLADWNQYANGVWGPLLWVFSSLTLKDVQHLAGVIFNPEMAVCDRGYRVEAMQVEKG